MTYIVGDIHGELAKLENLVTKIQRADQSPSFVFIGDYIDKGPEVVGTLQLLSELSRDHECVFLCGNHEYLLLNLEESDIETENYLLRYGGRKTMASAGVQTLHETKQVLVEKFPFFFSSLKPFWQNDKYVAVHSGIAPSDYNTALLDIPLKDLLFNRYEFLKTERSYLGQYKVIFGHTAFFLPYVDNYKIGIDTGACYLPFQPITAFCIEEEGFLDSNGKSYDVKDFPSGQCSNIIRVRLN